MTYDGLHALDLNLESKRMILAVILFSLAFAQEEICKNSTNGTFCFPKMFIPSNEFQIIHPEQFVPPGLHLRMDLESGLKEGKLMHKSKGKDVINVPAVKISELPMEHSSLTVQEKKSLMQLLDDLDDPVSLLKNLEFLSEVFYFY